MIRTLAATAMLGLYVGLAGCQPASETEANLTAGRMGETPMGEPIPAAYDWHFLAHGGSGDLDFGDGDWVEGVSLFHASCLPGSGTLTVSWGYPDEAVLTAATGTFAADQSVASDHPVFSALRAGGTLAVGLNGADMMLEAKAAGQEQLEAFFAYCARPSGST